MRIRLVLVLLALAAAPAAADEVRLANGDRFTGQVVSLSGGTLTFSTPHGEVRIPWELVTSLTVDTPALVSAGADPIAVDRAAGNATSGLTLDPGGTVGFSEITTIARPISMLDVNGSANAGFIRSSGNNDLTSIRLDGDLGVRAGANRYTATAVTLRTTDRDVLTARNWSTSLKYDRFLSTRLFLNANGIFTSDRFRDLDLRTALGAGVGYQVADTARLKLTTYAGVGWVDENLRLLPGDSYTAVRESASLDIFIVLPDRLQLFHQHDGYFGVTGDDNMFVRTQNGVRVGLGAGLVTTLRLDFDYDRTPAPGRRNVDRSFALTLGYQF